MLTKLTIRNFKRFGEVEIELGSPVVFIGPNNSGKTSAMQALALWDIGLKRWNEKRSGKKSTPEKRPGVTVNRRDLMAIPIPAANLLWRGLHVRDVHRVNGQQRTAERGEIAMTYHEHGAELDLSSAGRGLQQTLLLLDYHGLREALPTLGGVALFDHLESEPLDISPVECLIWKRREIENYICSRATLEKYASASASASGDAASGPLFAAAEVEKRQDAMSQAIEEVESALKTLGKGAPWSADIKASDDFLVPLFKSYFEILGLPNLMAKNFAVLFFAEISDI